MNKQNELLYILLITSLIALAILFLSSVNAQTQEYINLTIRLLDYENKPLFEGNSYPTLKIYYTNGTFIKSVTCEAAVCTLINFSTGSYSFKVYWRSVEVAYVNKTITATDKVINITCNARKVRIRVVDDKDIKIKNVDVSFLGPLPGYQNSYAFNTGEGEIVKLLPFGTYRLGSAIWQWEVDDKTFSVDISPGNTMEYVVGINADFIKIQGKVMHSLTLVFYTLDEEELVGDEAEVELEFYYRGKWARMLNQRLSSSNKITLSPLPYGEYRVTLYWEEVPLFSETISVDENLYDQLEDDMLKLTVSMYRSLVVRFVNAQGEALEDMYVVLISPYGENSTYKTDDTGKIRLANITAGVYVAKLRWIAGYAEVELDLTPEKISGHMVEVVVDFYNVNFEIYPKGSDTLPEGLRVSFKCNNVLLWNESLKEEENIWENSFEKLYSKAVYTLRVRYMNYTLYDEKINIKVGTVKVELDLYDLTVRVLSSSNSTLSGAQVLLRYPRGEVRRSETGEGGECFFKHLIAGYGTYEMDIYWKGFLVGSFTLEDEDISKGRIDVRVNVYDLLFKVYDTLRRGLHGVNVKVYLRNSTSTVLLANVTTDPTGLAKISNVPVPSRYDVVFDIDYKSKYVIKNVVLENPGKIKEITLDVLVEIFGFPLSTIETLALVGGATVGSIGIYLFIRWYTFKKEVSHMFLESQPTPESYEEYYPGYESERGKKKSLWKRLKERLRELFGGKEEEEYEEEYDVFG